MPPRRRRKTDAAAAAADVLLSLPTDILDDILSRVGLRDAVRTSVLSRAWTRRWEFIPSIDISADDGGMWKAPSAVDGILLRFLGRVRRFHVILDKDTSHRVNDWLPTLSRRGVESLSLKLRSHIQRDFRPPRLHESVFLCSSLTVLSLSTCTMPSFPLDWGFPNLRSLILSNVRFLEEYGHDQLQEIIETCPLLEDLRLVKVDLYGDIEFVMQAPKLRFLTLCLIEEFGCILQELPLLHSAAMDMWNYVPSNFAELLAALVQARNLQLHLCTEGGWEDGWYNWRPTIPRKLPCTFHSLKSLKLHMDFSEPTPIELTFLLLKSAPNLQILKLVLRNIINIIMSNGVREYDETDTVFLNEQWEDGMCANLQVVHMDGVYWLPDEMSFMELILSKASLLRTLSVSYLVENATLMRALQRSNKASPQAQVLFKVIEVGEDYNRRHLPCIAEGM